MTLEPWQVGLAILGYAFLYGFVQSIVVRLFDKFWPRKPRIVLVDMDGVIADWDHGWESALDELPEGHGLPRVHERVEFNLFHGLNAEQKAIVTRLTEAPGFYANLRMIPGAKAALTEMKNAGLTVFIVTSPWISNPTCASDKIAWAERHLGHEWAKRVIITTDKTMVRGDILVDDKPHVKGSQKPMWEQVWLDQPINRPHTGKRRIMNWTDGSWRKIIGLRQP